MHVFSYKVASKAIRTNERWCVKELLDILNLFKLQYIYIIKNLAYLSKLAHIKHCTQQV